MPEQKDILNKLVIDEKDVTKEMEGLVESAIKIFRIEKPSGRIIFQNFGSLKDKQRISAFLAAKFFATKLQINEKTEFSIAEIAKELNRPVTTLSKPLGNLIKKGLIEKLSGGKYKIAEHRLNELFEDILKN